MPPAVFIIIFKNIVGGVSLKTTIDIVAVENYKYYMLDARNHFFYSYRYYQ